MKKMKESIRFMQTSLNRLVQINEDSNMHAGSIYSLSVMLDKEIVKYYKRLSQRAC